MTEYVEIDDEGGSAFPNDGQHGMTLRDYFAAKALSHPYTAGISEVDAIARCAYFIADAMIKARDA